MTGLVKQQSQTTTNTQAQADPRVRKGMQPGWAMHSLQPPQPSFHRKQQETDLLNLWLKCCFTFISSRIRTSILFYMNHLKKTQQNPQSLTWTFCFRYSFARAVLLPSHLSPLTDNPPHLPVFLILFITTLMESCCVLPLSWSFVITGTRFLPALGSVGGAWFNSCS